jgi:hypothetical protein
MGSPNWCEGCGTYHSRDYRDCVRRQRREQNIAQATASPELANIDEDQLQKIEQSSDPRFTAGWRAGYEAAINDLIQRRAS